METNTTTPTKYFIEDVLFAEINLEPLYCKFCGSSEVVYDQYQFNGSCGDCGRFQLTSDTVNKLKNGSVMLIKNTSGKVKIITNFVKIFNPKFLSQEQIEYISTSFEQSRIELDDDIPEEDIFGTSVEHIGNRFSGAYKFYRDDNNYYIFVLIGNDVNPFDLIKLNQNHLAELNTLNYGHHSINIQISFHQLLDSIKKHHNEAYKSIINDSSILEQLKSLFLAEGLNLGSKISKAFDLYSFIIKHNPFFEEKILQLR